MIIIPAVGLLPANYFPCLSSVSASKLVVHSSSVLYLYNNIQLPILASKKFRNKPEHSHRPKLKILIFKFVGLINKRIIHEQFR